MILRLSLCGLISLLMGTAAHGQSQATTEWVITDAFLPIDPPGEEDAAWQIAYPLGDFDGDGKSDFILSGNIDWPSGSTPPFHYTYKVSPGLGEASYGDFSLFPFTAPVHPYSGWWSPHFAFLGSPFGDRIATLDKDWGSVLVLDSATLQWLGTVPFPTPPNGLPKMNGVEGIYPAGDVNQDGFDDLFVQGKAPQNYKVIAMVDGASLTMPWAHYEADGQGNFYPTMSGELDVPQDLNGDGAADFVSTFNLYHVVLQRFETVQVANSGLDGSVLWENRRWDTTLSPGAIGGKDVNGNGSPDYHTTTGFTVRMVDGSDGSTIWDIPREYLGHLFPSSNFEYRQTNPSFFTGVPGASGGMELCQYIYGWNIHTYEEFHGIAHLNASTGALLSFEELPTDLEPWYPDLIEYAPLNIMSLMGDIDRDGYTEVMFNPPVSEGDSPNIYGSPRPGVIFSQKTLSAPETQPIGTTALFQVSIPSSPGRNFRLLFSDVFEREGGLMLGEWRTHLGASRILNWSLGSGGSNGVLDSLGEGMTSIGIPAHPALSGRTLYSRAVVFENPGSSDIWTISTLGITELQ